MSGLGTPVVHRCETVPATSEESLVHVVLPPRLPGRTPLTDLKDAGHRVVSYGVLPEEIPECDHAEAHPTCEHFLVRPTEARP